MTETIESYKETARLFRRKVAWVRSNSRPGGLLERAYLPGASRAAGIKRRSIERLLKQLIDHATQRQFVYTHRWRTNDLVMWDDRCTMHRGMEFDDQRYKRDMRRATVSDVAPTCEQMGLAVAAE